MKRSYILTFTPIGDKSSPPIVASGDSIMSVVSDLIRVIEQNYGKADEIDSFYFFHAINELVEDFSDGKTESKTSSLNSLSDPEGAFKLELIRK